MAAKKCEKCSYTTSRLSKLKQHVKSVHDKIKDQQCRQCGLLLSTKQNLKNHEKIIHLKIKDHVCKECGSAFSKKHLLRRHEKVFHLNERDNVCHECGSDFVTISGLREHNKYIHQIMNRECPLCIKVFNHEENWKITLGEFTFQSSDFLALCVLIILQTRQILSAI